MHVCHRTQSSSTTQKESSPLPPRNHHACQQRQGLDCTLATHKTAVYETLAAIPWVTSYANCMRSSLSYRLALCVCSNPGKLLGLGSFKQHHTHAHTSHAATPQTPKAFPIAKRDTICILYTYIHIQYSPLSS